MSRSAYPRRNGNPHKPAEWSAALSRPIKVKNGPTLATLADVRAFMLGEPGHMMERPLWQQAAAALLAAAEDGGQVELATARTENALFMQARWMPPR